MSSPHHLVRQLSLSGLLIATAATVTPAQTTSKAPDPDLCLGVAFGVWKPALDWRAAGHGSPIDTARVPRAADGRAWAVNSVASPTDSTLLLFPVWWPAGVNVRLDRVPLSTGDTVSGSAHAMVADGHKTPPLATIRAWQSPCRR